RAGVCGEGADSLFGLGLANQVHNAGLLRRLLPVRLLRHVGKTVASAARWERLAATFALADALEDDGCLEHPVNQVAAFADWPAVEACFGPGALAAAAAGRRLLLER